MDSPEKLIFFEIFPFTSRYTQSPEKPLSVLDNPIHSQNIFTDHGLMSQGTDKLDVSGQR